MGLNNINLHPTSDSSTEKDEGIEALRRLSSRSQANKMQDKVAGLQWEIKKILIVEEEPKNYGEEWAKCFTYFILQA